MKGKIALFQLYPHSMGGLQAVVLQLGAGLAEMGWKPVIICPEEGQFVEAARAADLPVWVSDPGACWRVYGRGDKSLTYALSPRRGWQLARYWRQLARELRQREIALLHCNDYRAVMLAAPAARPDAALHILGGEFGDGSYARELENLVRRTGVAQRVFFRGHSNDVAGEMARCCVLAIPSRIEAFGMVAIEAMAAGKPVVATRTGGLKDIVEHGRTGFLVEDGDVDDVAGRLAGLLADHALREVMGKAGQERGRRLFTLHRVITSFDDLYRSLLGAEERAAATFPRFSKST